MNRMRAAGQFATDADSPNWAKYQEALAPAVAAEEEFAQFERESLADRIVEQTDVPSTIEQLKKAASDLSHAISRYEDEVGKVTALVVSCYPRGGQRLQVTDIDELRRTVQQLADHGIPEPTVDTSDTFRFGAEHDGPRERREHRSAADRSPTLRRY